ncbi:unnamed protein product [Durusdinium trenchii]|uniref:Reticulon-like protein n=1 Tax=Durusdinium trenchii TaxID=1381693 RepID=A0ABP0KF26_9DINO
MQVKLTSLTWKSWNFRRLVVRVKMDWPNPLPFGQPCCIEQQREVADLAAMEKGSMRSLMWESDLLMWKQPAVTGAVFGCFNCFFLAVYTWDLSLVPFLCNIFTLVLMAGGAVRYAAPQSADHSIEILSQDAIKVAVESISKVLNVVSQKVRDVVLWTTAEATFMAFGFLQLVRVATPYCSLLPIMWLIGNLLLSVPYACEANREQLEKHFRPYFDKAWRFKARPLERRIWWQKYPSTRTW